MLALALGGFGLYLLIGAGSFSGLYMAGLAWILYSEARAAIARSALEERIDGVRVGDIMDSEPVTIPADLPASQAVDDYFLRYRWPWFAVVDGGRAVRGHRHRGATSAAPSEAGEGWVSGRLARRTTAAHGWPSRRGEPDHRPDRLRATADGSAR